MPFVVDASITASWLLPDEGDARARAAFARLPQDHAIAPVLWWYEMRNIFVINERRGRIDTAQADRGMALLSALPIRLDHAADETRTIDLARRHHLTVYDAVYLELALRQNVPLATLDEALIRAASAEYVPLLGRESC